MPEPAAPLQEIINEQALIHKTMAFIPHVTLLGGLEQAWARFRQSLLNTGANYVNRLDR